MIIYRELQQDEIDRDLFRNFQRRQVVGECLRRVEGKWVVKDDPFVDDWTEAEYAMLVDCLRNTLKEGGMVAAAFLDGQLKGFVSVEAEPLGSHGQYMDLSSIHVSTDMRGKGIGRVLFRTAKEYAAAHGAQKLYISAHSAVETQAFYRAMGCREAEEYNQAHVEREPYDCQLECVL